MVTLVLGALGIINIMLVSVTERTREIGLMKALGQPTAHSDAVFLEGAFLTALSGGLGIAISAGVMAAGQLPRLRDLICRTLCLHRLRLR